MFRRIFLTGLLAGAIAGLFAAGVQQLKLVPLIAAAEVYETAAAAAQPVHQHDGKSDTAEWEPSPG